MTQASTAPGLRYRASLELLRVSEALWNASRVFLARWDLSPSQFNVLNLLHGQPAGRSQIDLSRELIMHRSNVTGLVDRLEARGLVRRKDNPTDRRAFNVVLTGDGEKLMRQILPKYFQAAEDIWGGLTLDQVGELVTRLKAVCANAERIAITPRGKRVLHRRKQRTVD